MGNWISSCRQMGSPEVVIELGIFVRALLGDYGEKDAGKGGRDIRAGGGRKEQIVLKEVLQLDSHYWTVCF